MTIEAWPPPMKNGNEEVMGMAISSMLEWEKWKDIKLKGSNEGQTRTGGRQAPPHYSRLGERIFSNPNYLEW